MAWKRVPFAACCLGLLLTGPAAAQTIFTEVTDQAFAGLPVSEARGLAWGDFDNDGWPDLFLAGFNNARIALWGNQGNGRFADYTAAIQLDEPPQKYGGGSIFGDYDQDGDLDLYVPTGVFQSSPTRNLLLRNERGAFVEVGLAAGLTDSLPTDNALWLDYDRDGYLDIYTGNASHVNKDPTTRDKLYRNQGNGTFVDVTQQAGLDLQLHPLWGGSNGGMAAGDFNDDGWPDLYVGVHQAPNRLFLNNGQGGFRDATTSEIGDPGEAFGVAVGDIDNDGDLEIFQAAGGSTRGSQRSLMLLNLGGGQFLDVTDGVGLGGLTGDTWGPGLADLDNDGDLDLVLANPLRLFLNNGEGIFSDQTDRLGFSTVGFGLAVSWGDGDLDGFLDMAIDVGGRLRLYHNKGNPNHYLRVELVGIKSNRNGIGARLIAKAGDLQQMREILGGSGLYQDEMVAHFGLGARTKVDRLEIRWPSGQVDVLTDIPADQKIRVFEGRAGYQVVKPSVWTLPLPDSLVVGGGFSGAIAVRPALFEEGARITQVVADLSELGGPAAAPLQAAGDGTWRLETTLKLTDVRGPKKVSVLIDQQTSLGPHWTQLSHTLLVLLAEDQVVFREEIGKGWQLGPRESSAGDQLGFFTLRDGRMDFNLIDADGTNQLRLTHGGPGLTYENFGWFTHSWSWSPDGQQLVFAGLPEGYPEGAVHTTLYVMNADGTHLRQLTFPPADRLDLQPSWSPDGRKIAFSSDRSGEYQIYVMETDGSNLVNLTNHPSLNGNPSWSPDGQQIAFDSNRDGIESSEIYVMDANGSKPVNLTNHPAEDFGPSWSPDGQKIAFVTNRDNGDYEIYVMAADGSNPTNLSKTPGQDFTPAWSPDGTRIAFKRGPQLFIMEADGSNQVQVTHNVPNYVPQWLPQGAPSPIQVLNLDTPAVRYQGRQARQLRAEKPWLATYQAETPVVSTGYAALGFAFHPGSAALPEEGWLKVRVNDIQLDLLGRIDLTRKEWQEVEIPLKDFALDRPIDQLEFSGLLQGTFYLDDLRLVAAKPSPITVVEEDRTAALPQSFSLSQNYPNPFNGDTVIRFALPASAEVELVVYNLAGQQVVVLAKGVREAGSYTVRWDGRDDQGGELASGVYLCRLRAGTQVETRKLLLLR